MRSFLANPSFLSLRSVFELGVAALLIGVLPNLLVWLVAGHLGLGRSLFNLDYVLIAAIMALGYWRVGLILVAVCVLVDMLSLAVQVFPFMRMQDVTYLLRFLWIAPDDYKRLLLAAVVLLVGVVLLFYCCRNRISKAGALAAVLVFLGVQVATGTEARRDSFLRVKGDKPVASGIADFASNRVVGFIANFKSDENPLAPYVGQVATDSWREELRRDGLATRLLLVVNESWGVPVNPLIQDALLRPLSDVAKLELGYFPFSGATVAGELRELCRMHPNHFGFRGARDELAECLPWKLRAKGYETSAMHGATGMMYDRRDWYPVSGFENDLFFEDVLARRRCYSFPGACDRDLMSNLQGYFSAEGKRFFYWLTLNTHSSYDRRDLIDDHFDCPSFGLIEGEESCRNLELQAQFFSDLANLLRTPEMAGVDVIVVGDHEPRFSNRSEMRGSFVVGMVPWVRVRVQ